MNPRATIALLALTLALVGAVVWLRLRVAPTREAEEARRYAAVFDPEAVAEIDIARGNETVSLRRGAGEWLIAAPISDRASPEAVDRILAGARFLEVRDRSAAEGVSALPEAGLATPRARIDLRGGEGARIDFGGAAPVPGTVFARVGGGKEVLRVPDTLAQLATTPLDNFRDPRLTSLVADDIEKFTVRRGDGEMTVRRERGRWAIDKPVVAAADPRAVREFLEPLLGLRVVSFGPQGAAAAALPGDSAVVSLTPRGGGEALELEVVRGAAAADKVSARLASRGGALEVDPEALRVFDVSPEALRDRSLGLVEADAVDRVRLESDGRVLSLRRDAGGWASEDGRKVGRGQIAALVKLFNECRVVAFRTAATAQETGLDQPARRVGFYAWLSENTPEEAAGRHLIAGAEFGTTAPGGNVYARATGSDETVAVPPALDAAIRDLVGAATPAP